MVPPVYGERNGEILVLVGPSGCRKSTTLRLIAGLENVTDGTIQIGFNEERLHRVAVPVRVRSRVHRTPPGEAVRRKRTTQQPRR